MIRSLHTFVLSAAVLLAGIVPPGYSQTNLFSPVVRVNDRVITQFELTQREIFFDLLRAPGNRQELALRRLVDERLQMDAGERLGITISDDELITGMEEFVARTQLSLEQFVAALNQGGVARETFEDFVKAGLVWRQIVQGRFGPRAQVSEEEIDRALASGVGGGAVRVLISEIFLPTDTPERRAQAQNRAARISQMTSISAFAAAARQFSAAPSRSRGGRQNWVPIANLPPQIRGQILTLAPGEVTDPIEVPNAIALFQLRDIEEVDGPSSEAVALEFARYFIPGGRTERTLDEARKIAADVDTCDDLYAVADGQPADRLLRDVLPVEQISGDIALELAKLDENEISTNLVTGDGQALVFLMLCGRTLALSEDVDREIVRQNLRNQRLQAYASGYLSELRADAVIQRLQ